MRVVTLMVLYLIVVNIAGFAAMGIDKSRAKKRAYRIPEANLFMLAIIGGSLGSILGMHLFHHKTRHLYFLYGLPAILVVQLLIVIALWLSPIKFVFL